MLIHVQSLYSASGVVQVNIPAATGDMGVLANHVASVEALRPGVIEVIEDSGAPSKKWFSKSWYIRGMTDLLDPNGTGRVPEQSGLPQQRGAPRCHAMSRT